MTCDVSVMMLSSYSVSKLHVIVEYSFLFPVIKKYKNRSRNDGVIVENSGTFFPDVV